LMDQPTNHHKHVQLSCLSCSIACGCSLRLHIFYHLSFTIIILILLWCLVRHWNLVLHFWYLIIT
jgi:dolichyl-phosphate-mannose--protein O-mannosyl transferase